jgi:hypothetical protein
MRVILLCTVIYFTLVGVCLSDEGEQMGKEALIERIKDVDLTSYQQGGNLLFTFQSTPGYPGKYPHSQPVLAEEDKVGVWQYKNAGFDSNSGR